MSELEDANPWGEDALERKKFALSWTKYLVKRAELSEEGVTAALEAPWGAGKTHFVQRWAEHLEQGHPVVTFDAWKNDHVSDPMLAFMAELTGQIRELKAKHKLSQSLVMKIESKSGALVKSMAAALVPTASVLAKAAAKKLLALDLNELKDAAFRNSDLSAALQGAEHMAGDVLAAYVKKSLEGYRERQRGVAAFRKELADFVELLAEAEALNLPLFVFIDEVDRCRPSFAISLLEEIKHVFGVKGIVFVLSVNMEQLANSVCALYGNAFDGRSYLQRFFDLEFALPRPTNLEYAKLLVQKHPYVPKQVFTEIFADEIGPEAIAQRAFADVSDLFALTLREQSSVALIASIADQMIDGERLVHWLYYLAALRFKAPDLFQKLVIRSAEQSDVNEVKRRFGGRDSSIRVHLKKRPNAYGWDAGDTSLIALLHVLYEIWSFDRTVENRHLQNEPTDFRTALIVDVLRRPIVVANRQQPVLAYYVTAIANSGAI